MISGLLSDEQQASRALSLTEDRLGRVLPEIAGSAALGGLPEFGERPVEHVLHQKSGPWVFSRKPP